MSGSSSISLAGLVQRFLGRLRFPQLFVVAALLFVLDLIVPDVIPFLEEVMLAVLTLLLGQWKKPEDPSGASGDKPPPKNVTPEA